MKVIFTHPSAGHFVQPCFYSWFHENSSFSVHSFEKHFLFTLYTGSSGNRFQETHGIMFGLINDPRYYEMCCLFTRQNRF